MAVRASALSVLTSVLLVGSLNGAPISAAPQQSEQSSSQVRSTGQLVNPKSRSASKRVSHSRYVRAYFPVLRKALIREHNRVRSLGVKCGTKRMKRVRALRGHSRLNNAAGRHSLDMRKRKFFSHVSSNGRQLGDRIRKAGYRFSYAGENLVTLQPLSLGRSSGTLKQSISRTAKRTATKSVAMFIRSPGHCKTLMSHRYRHVGVGLVDKSPMTFNFGRPI